MIENSKRYVSDSRLDTLAIVSGKGGSGKTLVATAIAEGLSLSGNRVLLVDADTGTGGLSYYLGFNAYRRTREGLAEFVRGDSETPNISSARKAIVDSNPAFGKVDLLPVGNHRIFHQRNDVALTDKPIMDLIWKIKESGNYRYIIFDCRGGIDS